MDKTINENHSELLFSKIMNKINVIYYIWIGIVSADYFSLRVDAFL